MVRPCLPLAGIGICSLGAGAALPDDADLAGPPLPSSPGFPAVATISVMTARMSSLRWAWVVAGASKTALRSAPAAVIQAVSWLGEGDGLAGALGGELVVRGARGCELVFQGGLQGPCHQPVFRLDVVVLAQGPAGFVAGAFGGAFEHGQVLAVPGRASARAWTVAAREAGASTASSSSRTVSCSRRPPIHWQDLAPYIWCARPHR